MENMIMNGVTTYAPKDFDKSKEQLDTAIDNKKMMEAMARYKAMHTPIVKKYHINRNDPCPCGSGKKFKNCCINKEEYHK